jgi:hypothetical protein
MKGDSVKLGTWNGADPIEILEARPLSTYFGCGKFAAVSAAIPHCLQI